MAKSQGKKGGRKIDRNTKWCEAYRKRNQRERNKLRRLRKHLVRFPKDRGALAIVERIIGLIGNTRLAAE